MNSGRRRDAILDTSVLLNFLAVDRADLLTSHLSYQFLITEHVRLEVTDRRPGQVAKLNSLIERSLVKQIAVSSIPELTIFARLYSSPKRFGPGECAAIAAAMHRAAVIAIDDNDAIKTIKAEFSTLVIETTESIIVGLIRAGALTVAEADFLKEEWATKHRFRLKFSSFANRR